jgi:hypothetical protein
VRTIEVVAAPRNMADMAHQETDAARIRWCYNRRGRGHRSGDHVPEYVLFAAYGLLAVGVVACLALFANTFYDDDKDLERVDRDQ